MRSIFIAIIFVGVSSCQEKKENVWYSKMREKIVTESDKLSDSASRRTVNDKLVEWTYYSKGTKFKAEMIHAGDSLGVKTLFDNSGQFELRQEFCKGQVTFEGITYKSRFFGSSKWWNCERALIESGIRYNDVKIGKWEYWDGNGKLTVEEYGKEALMDSLLLLE